MTSAVRSKVVAFAVLSLTLVAAPGVLAQSLIDASRVDARVGQVRGWGGHGLGVEIAIARAIRVGGMGARHDVGFTFGAGQVTSASVHRALGMIGVAWRTRFPNEAGDVTPYFQIPVRGVWVDDMTFVVLDGMHNAAWTPASSDQGWSVAGGVGAGVDLQLEGVVHFSIQATYLRRALFTEQPSNMIFVTLGLGVAGRRF